MITYTHVKLPMSDSEILSNYNHAKFKPAQITILANLNNTTQDVIRAILTDNGCILDAQKDTSPAPVTESAAADVPKSLRMRWTQELKDQIVALHTDGLTNAAIADRIGAPEGAVSAQLSALRLRANKEATPVPLAVTPPSSVRVPPASVPALAPAPKALNRMPDYILARIRYAVTMCNDTVSAFSSSDDARGYISLGELRQVLNTLKYDAEKEAAR